MFDIGFWEILLIGTITLIVVGPERIPTVAHKAGKIIGKLKNTINKIKYDINKEIDAEQLEEYVDSKKILKQLKEDIDSKKILKN